MVRGIVAGGLQQWPEGVLQSRDTRARNPLVSGLVVLLWHRPTSSSHCVPCCCPAGAKQPVRAGLHHLPDQRAVRGSPQPGHRMHRRVQRPGESPPPIRSSITTLYITCAVRTIGVRLVSLPAGQPVQQYMEPLPQCVHVASLVELTSSVHRIPLRTLRMPKGQLIRTTRPSPCSSLLAAHACLRHSLHVPSPSASSEHEPTLKGYHASV